MENNDLYMKLEMHPGFPLYAVSRELIKRYRPYLDPLDLTYTQYIAMLVFWEVKIISVKDLGKRLFLDSGTLTPVLKSLESKGYVNRYRSTEDERVLLVEITEKGEQLKTQAMNIPQEMTSKNITLSKEELDTLYSLVYKLLDNIENM